MTVTYGFADGVNIAAEIRGQSKLFLNGSKTPEPDLGVIEGADPKENDEPARCRNFIDAVRANNRELLCAEVVEPHRSTAYPLPGNIAWRLGREVHFDPKTERFAGDAEADGPLTRRYRAPYAVPEKVQPIQNQTVPQRNGRTRSSTSSTPRPGRFGMGM